jgi:hypothetical protein
MPRLHADGLRLLKGPLRSGEARSSPNLGSPGLPGTLLHT